MAKLVTVKGAYGNDCVFNVDNIDAIIFLKDGTAKVFAGSAEISVTHEEARKLQKIIDPLA